MGQKAVKHAPPGSTYADQRPYVVIKNLDDLHGPTSGTVLLDRRLHWSGTAAFDLDNPRRLASLYETVLREASHADDLVQWLNGPTLVRVWPVLVLPPPLRALWESRYGQLRRTAA